MTATIIAPSSRQQDYRSRGFVSLHGRFSPEEIAAWRDERDRLTAGFAHATAERYQRRRTVGGAMVTDRIDPVCDVSPVFAGLTADDRILAPVGELLGEAPALLKAKLIVKRPGTAGYGLHQDFPYWAWLGVPAEEMVSVMVAIDPSDATNGGLEVFPGLHHERLQPSPDDPRDIDEQVMDLAAGSIPGLAAGDLLVFHSLTPHRSAANTSEASRTALFLTYAPARHGDLYTRYHASGRPGH
ncbi:MAG TPA: phytanoyl-CoA dioxygenase family protein [Gemmatimonadales bacterium]|nr:phytanoyl-CoA dioxygenase family protein [Gemmatimonadales bacterium]